MEFIYETAESGIRAVVVFCPDAAIPTDGLIDARSLSGSESWLVPLTSLLRPISRERAKEILQHEVDKLCFEIASLRGELEGSTRLDSAEKIIVRHPSRPL